MLVLGVALALESIVMATFGVLPARFDGVASTLGAVLALAAGILGGPLVGAIAALLGGILFVSLVTGLNLGSALSVAVWVIASAAAGVIAERYRRLLRDRDEAHEVGVRARLESERARGRLARLQRVTVALSEALSSDDAIAAVAQQAVEVIGASGAVVGLVDGRGDALDITFSAARQAKLAKQQNVPVDAKVSLCEAYRTGQPLYLSGDEWRDRFPDGYELFRPLGSSFVVRPLIAGEDRLGAIGLAFGEGRDLGPEDLEMLDAIVGQVALAVRRARTIESESQIAATLQDRLLPGDLPKIDGVELWACYIASTDGLDIGGDWYDAIALPDGSVCLAVGDVCGHGLEAAAAMGQLRSAWRALASDEGSTPATVLTTLDRFADDMPGVPFSTVAVVRLEPSNGSLDLACAGHPPPLVLSAEGEAAYLPGGRSMPLGVPWQGEREEQHVELQPGSTLILYSDGLIERRGEPIDRGMQRLRDSAAARSGIADLEGFGEALAKITLENREDDMTLLLLRLDGERARFRRRVIAEPRELTGFRHELGEWMGVMGIEAAVRDDVILACSEAVSNAIEHGYLGSSGEVEVTVGFGDDGSIEARVVDRGTWRTGGPDPLRGRGLTMMRSIMDAVEVSTGSAGTTVVMRLAAPTGR
jgi:serine phosphatase RsbU (regulator of sigma subunit)/anti-sigma regulatory factor (Ser/Thr protein kinase)